MRRRTVVLAALAAGALVLATTGQTWVTATGLEGSAVPSATASGGRVSPVGTALAIVVMAAALALTTARRAGMLLIGLVMAVSGVVIASAAITAALDPAAAAAGAVAEVTGTTAPAAGYAVSAWPWVSGLGGVLALALGVLTLV
ncbi:Trp biosynthesis-associated membrane protein, partial [uncultured Micrococcus sp.]|uniref:Trp biosynthesis-associated membrane protein n=1 Tax=uncultured Micrococcus sp. TaxID=114051 RepID=UPI0025F6C81C